MCITIDWDRLQRKKMIFGGRTFLKKKNKKQNVQRRRRGRKHGRRRSRRKKSLRRGRSIDFFALLLGFLK